MPQLRPLFGALALAALLAARAAPEAAEALVLPAPETLCAVSSCAPPLAAPGNNAGQSGSRP